jgi:D-methionine transport system ATP-binding protein
VSGYLDIRNVSKAFNISGRELQVLRNVNLSVDKGEIYGIIGFSGAGKSTLARCINRLETPDAGEILVDGVDVVKLKGKELRQERRKVGMIFQNFNLFEAMTVEKNIAYPLEIEGVKKAEIKKRVQETAELVGLADKLKAYPGGLSGGQKQRVGIARTLIGQPDVLLSDEATSALDPQTTLNILDLLKDINERLGITILMITHELDAIRYSCDKMAVLENGQITESGAVADIFRNPQSKTGELFAKVSKEFRRAENFTDGEGI